MTRLLVIDTAGPQVRLDAVEQDRIVAAIRPDSSRHVRGLTVHIRELLHGIGWDLKSISALGVNVGPGTFTGIRVGLSIAKAICYSRGTKLIAVDMFDGFALGCRALDLWPHEYPEMDVFLEGQLQSFTVARYRKDADSASRISMGSFPQAEIVSHCDSNVAVTGMLDRLQILMRHDLRFVGQPPWDESRPSIVPIVSARARRGQFDDPMTIEPLYVRPSSAEEKWERRST